MARYTAGARVQLSTRSPLDLVMTITMRIAQATASAAAMRASHGRRRMADTRHGRPCLWCWTGDVEGTENPVSGHVPQGKGFRSDIGLNFELDVTPGKLG